MKVRGKQMAGKNTADVGFEKQIWERPACCAEIWMHLNIKM